jgi:hypothetical protein
MTLERIHSVLDYNGFPVEEGDLVEMTPELSPELKGEQGVVVKVAPPNICYVQLERQISWSLDRDARSNQPEVLAAAGFLWKLVAKGASCEID